MQYGDNMWKKVKEQINLEADFVANETYPEAQLGKMGKTAMKILRLGAVHILRKHILGSLNTLGGVVSAW